MVYKRLITIRIVKLLFETRFTILQACWGVPEPSCRRSQSPLVLFHTQYKEGTKKKKIIGPICGSAQVALLERQIDRSAADMVLLVGVTNRGQFSPMNSRTRPPLLVNKDRYILNANNKERRVPYSFYHCDAELNHLSSNVAAAPV